MCCTTAATYSPVMIHMELFRHENGVANMLTNSQSSTPSHYGNNYWGNQSFCMLFFPESCSDNLWLICFVGWTKQADI